MLNLQNVSLALVLSAPFGLAIYDEITKETPTLDELPSGLFGADYLGYDDSAYAYDDYDDDDIELSDEEVARILRESGYSGELADVEPEEAVAELTPAALQELFGAERATLGPTLSGARFGMSYDQVVAAVPTIEMFSLGDPDMFPEVAVYPDYTETSNARLTGVTVGLRDPSDRVEDHLVRAWGEPQIGNRDEGFIIWIGADGHSRAVLASEGRDLRKIRFDHAMTVEELFARPRQGKGVFSFENQRPILGATIEQLEARYHDVAINPYDQQSGELVLPGIATDHEARGSLLVELMLSERKVTHMILMVPCLDTECTDVVAAATRRFGTPANIGDEGETRLRFGKAPALTVYVLEGERLAEVTATFAQD